MRIQRGHEVEGVKRLRGWRVTAYGLAAIMGISLMAATCWSWDGKYTRLLRTEEVLKVLQGGSTEEIRAGIVVVMESAEAHIDRLCAIAERWDDVGVQARLALERLRERLDK